MARALINLFVCLLSFITLTTAAVKPGYPSPPLSHLQSRECSIPFVYKGSKYQTWYITYSPPVYTSSHRPLIAPHGGPGLSYNYVDSTSTTKQATANPSTSIPNPFDYDGFDIPGHLWGGMLGAGCAVLKPKGLNMLILSDLLAAMGL